MNVLVTFNAHLLCLTHSLIDSPSFLFFTPFCSVYFSLCLVLYYAIRFKFTFICLHFVLTKSIWLAFVLSRDVFVLTRIKTRMVFPDRPLLTLDEGPSLETSIFPLSFQVVREPLPSLHVSLNTLPTLATLVQDIITNIQCLNIYTFPNYKTINCFKLTLALSLKRLKFSLYNNDCFVMIQANSGKVF